MSKGRWLLLVALAALVAAFFAFGLDRYFSLALVKAQREQLVDWRDLHPLGATLLYFAAYVAVATLSLPGTGLMTLTAGAVFGLAWGMPLVIAAASVGATAAMLVARYLLGESIQQRYSRQLHRINRGVERDGAFYLFTLRLSGFPFFIINATMGLTPIRTWTFFWVSLVGMVPGTLVLLVAGTQIAKLESMSDIFTPQLIGAFLLLGLFPLLARKTAALLNARKRKTSP